MQRSSVPFHCSIDLFATSERGGQARKHHGIQMKAKMVAEQPPVQIDGVVVRPRSTSHLADPLLLTQRAQVLGKVVGRAQGVGVVLTQCPPFTA